MSFVAFAPSQPGHGAARVQVLSVYWASDSLPRHR